LSSPASGEGVARVEILALVEKFPIYWVPQRVGSPPY